MLLKDKLITQKPILTVNDFLNQYDSILDYNDKKDTLQMDFQLDSNHNNQKICPTLQIAKPDNAKEIVKLINNVYHGTYPYKRLQDIHEIQNMIYNSENEWIIFKINPNKSIGCFGTSLDFHKKRGLLHGFVLKEDYHHIIDVKKTYMGCILHFWKTYQNRISIWFAEVRTNESTPQYVTSLYGLKPIAFLPNKDIFMNRVESDFLNITYNNDILKDYRFEESPNIIRQILNSYTYSNKRYHFGTPHIENPNINLEQGVLDNLNGKIKKKIKTDKFSNQKIILFIKDSESYLKFFYNPYSKNCEKTEYKVERLEELFLFVKELKTIIRQGNINYFECYVSAFKPTHQKIFLDAGFKPMGYIPSWEYIKEKKKFEDYILFNYFKGPLSMNIKLIPESKELLHSLNFYENQLLKEQFDSIIS